MTATSTTSLAATSKDTQSCYTPAATSQAATKIDDSSMSSAALLKLNVDTWLILDHDWPSQVQLLNKFVPFPVEVVLTAPNSTASAKMVVLELARHDVKPCANGWFQCSFNVALSIFGGVVSGCPVIVPALSLGLHTGASSCVEDPKSSECGLNRVDMAVHIAQNTESTPLLPDLPDIEPTTMVLEEPVDEACDEQAVDPKLWDFVNPGVGRDMDKATDIRTAITAKLGKQRAAELLSKTRVAVVRDSKGRNTRILRAGGVALKLK